MKPPNYMDAKPHFIFQLLLWLILLFSQINTYAQINTAEEAIHQANESLATNNFNNAITLLKSHKENPDAAQLLAQIYYWNGNIKEAKKTYLNAISNHPTHHKIQLDYGRMLYELGEAKLAKKVLSNYLKTDAHDVEANLYLGYLYFEKGSFETSKKHFQTILLQNNTHVESLNMLRHIKNKSAWYLESGASLQVDNQPLQVLNPFVKIEKFHNRFLHPDLEFQSYFFDRDTLNQQAHKIEIGNTFTLPKAQFKLRISSGLFMDYIDGGSHWLGSVFLDKKIFQKFSLQGKWKHEPVFNAATSLDEIVTTDQYSMALKKENGDAWMGHLAYQYTDYFDGNSIQTAYLWWLSPAFKWNTFKLRIGYAGAFSDAKENRFSSTVSLEDFLENFEEDKEVVGIYTPYFTPKNQLIHSVIATSELQITKAISIQLNGNIGFSASADIPYLYLDSLATEVGFVREFFQEKTTNIELKAAVKYAVTKNITLNAHYQYSDNFFYRASAYEVKLNWRLHD